VVGHILRNLATALSSHSFEVKLRVFLLLLLQRLQQVQPLAQAFLQHEQLPPISKPLQLPLLISISQ
jgi:uncharacterized coiled-coil protein SlyX